MNENGVEKACIAYLVRHGATANNQADPPLLQGRGVDGPLSQDGQRQAAAAAEFLASKDISAIYSSPLNRAQQTAQEIAKPHELGVHTVDEISEADEGAWESRSWVEIERTERDAYDRFQNDPATYGYRGGENLTQVAARVEPAIESVMAKHLGEQIVIVAHNVVNRVLIARFLDLPLGRARNLSQNNCGVNTIRYRGGDFKVITVNATHGL